MSGYKVVALGKLFTIGANTFAIANLVAELRHFPILGDSFPKAGWQCGRLSTQIWTILSQIWTFLSLYWDYIWYQIGTRLGLLGNPIIAAELCISRKSVRVHCCRPANCRQEYSNRFSKFSLDPELQPVAFCLFFNIWHSVAANPESIGRNGRVQSCSPHETEHDRRDRFSKFSLDPQI